MTIQKFWAKENYSLGISTWICCSSTCLFALALTLTRDLLFRVSAMETMSLVTLATATTFKTRFLCRAPWFTRQLLASIMYHAVFLSTCSLRNQNSNIDNVQCESIGCTCAPDFSCCVNLETMNHFKVIRCLQTFNWSFIKKLWRRGRVGTNGFVIRLQASL